jgi:amino acid transporter
MGPAQAVTFSLLFGFSFAGAALPLSAVLALIAIVLIANCVGQLAKQMPSAGGLYSYASGALGSQAGFIVGWSFLVVEVLVPCGYGLIGGITVQGVIENASGISGTWWVWTSALIVLFAFLNYRSVELSTNAGVVLGVIEIAVIGGLALHMIFAAGSANTLAVFDPSNALEGGWAGVFKGMVFVILAAQGFEAAAPLGEEASNPRRTIPRAVLLSAVIVGIFYVVAAYGTVMGWGFDNMASYAEDPDPWNTLARSFWGAGWVLVFFAVINSVFAGGNAGAVASTRTLYAMGRTNVLPSFFGRTHPVHQTPHVAVIATAAIAAILALASGLYWGPVNALGILGTMITLLALLVYITTCIGCTIFYLRKRRSEFNPVLHGVVPAAATLVLLAPVYFQFNPLPEYPILWGTWFTMAVLFAGVAILILASLERPEALAAAQGAFAEREAKPDAGKPMDPDKDKTTAP